MGWPEIYLYALFPFLGFREITWELGMPKKSRGDCNLSYLKRNYKHLCQCHPNQFSILDEKCDWQLELKIIFLNLHVKENTQEMGFQFFCLAVITPLQGKGLIPIQWLHTLPQELSSKRQTFTFKIFNFNSYPLDQAPQHLALPAILSIQQLV